MRWAISLAVLLMACSSSPPPCTVPEGVIIRWGTWDDSLKTLQGYQLDWRGTVVTYRQTTTQLEPTLLDTLRVTIPRQTHCQVVEALRQAFVRNQTYFVLGPESHYVEYVRGTTVLRAVWDTRFQTYGSREFRAIFRWLHHLVGNDEAARR